MLKEFKGYKKGIDFGGWLSQCDHTKDRYDNFIVDDDFTTVAKWGVDHIRVPVDYELVEENDGNYIEEGFGYIQYAIDQCKKNNLNMILDLHKTFGYSFDSGYGESGFFENEKLQERFYKLWEEFAKRFASNEDMLAFELLNEVTDKEYGPIWNDIAEKCITRIREIAPTVTILVGGYWNNSAVAVKDLAMPHDENIVYNFHCYDPLIFTHQGAHWVDRMPLDYKMEFDHTYNEFKEIIHRDFPEWDDGFYMPEDAGDKPFGADYFIGLFEEAVKVAEERGVSLYCGEYGVIEKADPEDQVKWFKAINEAFEHFGLARAAWSYKEMDFGLIDVRLDGVRDEIIKLL